MIGEARDDDCHETRCSALRDLPYIDIETDEVSAEVARLERLGAEVS